MLALELINWWYGRGWITAGRRIATLLVGVSRLFSIPILLRTLFAPWKRIVTYPGASLEAKLHAYGDNLVSRAIGFTVRILVLITALCAEAVALIAGVIGFMLWPVIPLGVVLLIVKGVVG